MLTTIWRHLQSRSNCSTKTNSPQRKRLRRRRDSFCPCETLEKRQFLSANTIGYTGESAESQFGTAYVTQEVGGGGGTQATETVVLSSINTFLSSAGVQAGTVGAEQLPVVEMSQGVELYQVAHPVVIEDDGSMMNPNTFTSLQDALAYETGKAIDLDLNVYAVQTAASTTLLDLSSEQSLSFLRSQLVNALDTATTELNGLTDLRTFILIDAESKVQNAQSDLDYFEMTTGWGVTYADQVNLYESLGKPFLSHGSHTGDYEFPSTSDGLVVVENGDSQQAIFGIQVDNSVVYGAGSNQANPLTASNFSQYMLAKLATEYVPDVHGVYMPTSPSLFETDGAASEFICLSSLGDFNVIKVERPALKQRVSMDLGYRGNGPMPVTIDFDGDAIISAATGTDSDDQNYIISNVAHGTIEKLTSNGWVDISSPPKSTSPLRLLQKLQQRKIKSTDSLRWVQPASDTGSKSIKILNWQKRGTGSENSPASILGETLIDVQGASDLRATTSTPQNYANALNKAIKGSNNNATVTGAGAANADTYSANGLGVLVRNFNDGQQPASLYHSQQNFIAASMIHNDLDVPTSVYPAGPQDIIVNKEVVLAGGIWATPTLVGVYNMDPNIGISTSVTSDIWYDEIVDKKSPTPNKTASQMKNAQLSTWDWGVLYPHDSNSESRAVPAFKNWEGANPNNEIAVYDSAGNHILVEPGQTLPDLIPFGDTDPDNVQWIYDAPSAYSDAQYVSSNVFAEDQTKYGSNDRYIGNPLKHLKGKTTTTTQTYWEDNPDYGAGAGIHTADSYGGSGNKFFEGTGANENTLAFAQNQGIIENAYGELNGDLEMSSGDWTPLFTKLDTTAETYFTSNGGNWLGDIVMPWADNPRDMINVSNQLYDNRQSVFGRDIPAGTYWGWNEVPAPGKLQYPDAHFTSVTTPHAEIPAGVLDYKAGTYPNAYAQTNNQAINNQNVIQLNSGAGTLSAAGYKTFNAHGDEQPPAPGLALVADMTFEVDPAVVSQSGYTIPLGTKVSSVSYEHSTNVCTVTLNNSVTLPANAQLMLKGKSPTKLTTLAFVLPQSTGVLETYKTLNKYINQNDKIHAGIADQLDWYGRMGYLQKGVTKILTMQQSTANSVDTPDANISNAFAKQFIVEPDWTVTSNSKINGANYKYHVQNGLLVEMGPA